MKRNAGGVSRRQFLGALGAAGAGALMPSWAMAQSASAGGTGTGKPYRIDVHHHLLSPAYIKHSTRFGLSNARSDPAMLHWSPAVAIENMDKMGIATAVLSIAVGGIRFGNDDATRELVREDNEFGAKMVRDYPGRFGQFAALPLPDQDATLKEIEYALDTLKADGVALVTDYGDKWPGDPAYAPAFEELNRRKAVVFIHPTAPSCCTKLIPNVPESWVEYDFDTSRAFMSLLVNGAFGKYPDIRFVFTHSGGTLPSLTGRIEGMFPPKVAGARAPNGVGAVMKKLYFDVANGANPPALDALLAVAPVSQMLFGTDFPFVRMDITVDGLEKYKFSASDRQAINRENALRLLPQLKA
jgi:6-methylsalicylate decarboxylase